LLAPIWKGCSLLAGACARVTTSPLSRLVSLLVPRRSKNSQAAAVLLFAHFGPPEPIPSQPLPR
jgi:hypothetical protein